MAQTTSKIYKIGPMGAYTKRSVQSGVAIGTSNTPILGAVRIAGCKGWTLLLVNGTSKDVTAKIWASNKANPSTLAGTGWARIGSSITVKATGDANADDRYWTQTTTALGDWLGVSGTVASGTSTAAMEAYLIVTY